MELRRGVRVMGRLLVGLGLFVLAFVAYQLVGTNIAAAKHQQTLRQQFALDLRKAPASAAAAITTTSPPAPPSDGSVIGIIRAPAINLDKALVQGVSESDLQEGPGHYPSTPLPGEPGNVAIAGHRTTYGAPFFRLNELKAGDPIYVTTAQGTFTYRVTRELVVSPLDVAVLGATNANLLTLTTCNPLYSAAQRLVAEAVLQGSPHVALKPRAGVVAHRSTPLAAAQLAGGAGAWFPALAWGLGLIAAGVLTWLLARAWRRRGRLRGSLGYLVGAPFVLVFLYLFFASVSTLLPASF
jgi:sortase A